MAFDDKNYEEEYSEEAESSFNESVLSNDENDFSNSQNIYEEKSGAEIEYLTREEMISKLRDDMSGYISNMQNEIRDDMRIVGELNSRAASLDNPELSALYMTVAAELADSIDQRLETEINSKLAEALGNRRQVEVGGSSVTGVIPFEMPAEDKDNVITATDWEKIQAREEYNDIYEYEPEAPKKLYVLKDKNGQPVKGKDILDEMQNELRSQIYSANKERISEEKLFLDRVDRHIDKYERLRRSDDVEQNSFAQYSWGYRDHLNKLKGNFSDSTKKDLMNRALLDRSENLRNIGHAMIEGGLMWHKKYGVFDEQSFADRLSSKFNASSGILPYDTFRMDDDRRVESTINTMAYLTEKARNAVEIAANGGSPRNDITKLDKTQLGVLKSALDRSDSDEKAVSASNNLLSRFEAVSNSNRLDSVKAQDPFAGNNKRIGMCILSDEGEDIHASDFIDKISTGKPLTEAERKWACRQFDIMAERTGADIRGMYVNGEPVFHPDFYKQDGYEDKAKCVLIASALEGKRIAALPAKDGVPETDKNPVPVTVMDMVEPTLSLWERILEFFGLGRGSRIREANKLDSAERSNDESYIRSDAKHNAAFRVANAFLKDKTLDLDSGNRAQELKEMAENAKQKSVEILDRNEREFFSRYYKEPEEEAEKNGTLQNKVGLKIGNSFTYTGEKGKTGALLSTLSRDASRTHFMYLYGMTKGYTLDEMVNGTNVDRAAIGNEFMDKYSVKKLDEFAAEKSLDVTSPETRKNYNEYVLGKKQDLMKLSTEMYEALKKQEYKAPDPNDPEACIRDYALNDAYFTMICDYVQVFGSIRDNDLNPSDPNALPEVERTQAINNYEYYKTMPLQSYFSAYSKYMDYLSSDDMLSNAPSDSVTVDMAARGKAFLEHAAEWTKGKKTWGDIMDDKKLAFQISGCASMCLGEDESYNKAMNDVNYAYLHSTDKNFGYINIDPKHFEFKRLGTVTNNEDVLQANKIAAENAINEAAKYLPEGFEKNLDESFGKVIAPEKEAKAPVREKMRFDDLLGSPAKRVSKTVAHSEKQLENEKSKGSMGK